MAFIIVYLIICNSGSMEEAVDAVRKFYALLYGLSHKYKTLHKSLNELRTKLAVTTDEPMSKLPPCEPVFIPEVKRLVWQTKNWINARDPMADNGSVLDHGWEKSDFGLSPTMYTGPTSSELISGLYCECSGRNACEDCPCYLNGLPCIDICNCGGESASCKNEKTLFATNAPDTD